MIKEGDIRPLHWGMSFAELRALLPDNAPFDWGTDRIGRQGLLDVDGLEFHFVGRRADLYLLVIKAWRLAPDAVSSCFDFGRLHQELTLEQLRQELDRHGWPHELLHDRSIPTIRCWCSTAASGAASREKRMPRACRKSSCTRRPTTSTCAATGGWCQ